MVSTNNFNFLCIRSTGRTQVFFSLDPRIADEKHGSSANNNNVPVDHKFLLQGIGNQNMAVFSQTVPAANSKGGK